MALKVLALDGKGIDGERLFFGSYPTSEGSRVCFKRTMWWFDWFNFRTVFIADVEVMFSGKLHACCQAGKAFVLLILLEEVK